MFTVVEENFEFRHSEMQENKGFFNNFTTSSSSKFILDNMFPKGTLFTSTRIMYKNEKCNIKQITNNYKNVHTNSIIYGTLN